MRDQGRCNSTEFVRNQGVRISRREFLSLAALSAGCAALPALAAAWTPGVLSAAPAAVLNDAPNVLLIVMDTVRAESMSLYGYARPTTPNLERLAKHGVSFEQAIATAPWTLPSHSSMFTGRWHHEQSTDWYTPLDDSFPTLAELLGAHGYATAGFIANTSYCSREFGLSRGFVHYEDFAITPWDVFVNSSLLEWLANDYELRRKVNYFEILHRKSAEQVNQEFLSWVANTSHRPFFAFLNYFDAHRPYLPPPPYDNMFGPSGPRRDPWIMQDVLWTPEDLQVEKNAYEGAVAYIDHQIGILYAELERRGLSENTIVIIVSDHGEQFGEHSFVGKFTVASGQTRDAELYLVEHMNGLYIQALHVPLLILFPVRVPVAQSFDQPVSLRDIPATVLELAGLGATSPLPGSSLARHWKSAKSPVGSGHELVLSEINGNRELDWLPLYKGDMKSLVLGHYHYILNGDGTEEIYDYHRDTSEKHNLVGAEEGTQLLLQFRKQLSSCGSSHGASC